MGNQIECNLKFIYGVDEDTGQVLIPINQMDKIMKQVKKSIFANLEDGASEVINNNDVDIRAVNKALKEDKKRYNSIIKELLYILNKLEKDIKQARDKSVKEK